MQDSLTLQGGGREIGLYRMQGVDHADGMLVAWLPQTRVLVEADIFTPPAHARAATPTSINPYNVQLLDNIERLGLDVERLISIHYAADGRRVGMDELRLAAGRPRVCAMTGHQENVMPPIDRRHFIAFLGGSTAVAALSAEAKADAIEHYLAANVTGAAAPAATGPRRAPTVAELEAQIPTRTYRRGAGKLFAAEQGNVALLAPMPAKATLADFIRLRFQGTSEHCLQSARLARKKNLDEDLVFACLIHDLVLNVMRTEHGFWAAQMFEPYVSEKVTFAIRHHATLRFFPDHDAGYEYPELYRTMFGSDYVPPAHQQAEYQMGAQAPLVHGAAPRHGERSLFVRARRAGDRRRIRRRDRSPLQATQRGSRAGRQPRRPHVALGRESRQSSVTTGALLDDDADLERSTLRKIRNRCVLPLLAAFVISYLDRVNVGFAALTANADLGLTAAQYGLGAGLLFVAYSFFELPSNLALERFGARLWMARIMITWGLIGCSMALVTTPLGFLRSAIPARRGRSGALPRRDPLSDLLVAPASPGSVPGDVRPGHSALERDRCAGFGRHHAVDERSARREGVAVALRPGSVAGRAAGFRRAGVPCRSAHRGALAFARSNAPGSRPSSRAKLPGPAESHGGFRWSMLADRRVLVLGGVFFLTGVPSYGLSLWLPQIVKSFGVNHVVTGLPHGRPVRVRLRRDALLGSPFGCAATSVSGTPSSRP